MQSLDTATMNVPAARDTTEDSWKVPEILAPAGGRAQFFAALQAGADAVFLGLKQFNARGRAENFSLHDLRELMPLARQRGMKVLVTLNILLKQSELSRLLDDLIELQWIGVDAVIIQDLGVARLIRRLFPSLRLHASTQMAIHNGHGVRAAADLGFKRVVLARELTATELRRIKHEMSDREVEIESFCHGSLCYSYSGLCFFSGAEDARSGNRGECAYTCRKPYKILNEPGHGFLFSMKDLDTSLSLEKLVHAGIDTLKIEGRKKDAQYVATTVGLYRQELNHIFGRETSRTGATISRDYRHDMAFSFHRDTSSFFLHGRYHENVIDLANPTHKGLLIGTIRHILDRTIELETSSAIERFDGLRIDAPSDIYHSKPQHGEAVKTSIRSAQQKYANELCQFSLRDLWVEGSRTIRAETGQQVRIQIPTDVTMPRVGDLVYKIRSNELKCHTDALARAPEGYRLRALIHIAIDVSLTAEESFLLIEAHARIVDQHLARVALRIPAERPHRPVQLARDIDDIFHIFGDLGVEASIHRSGDDQWFVPKSHLKALKQELADLLQDAIPQLSQVQKAEALNHLHADRESLALRHKHTSSTLQIKIDRPEYLEALRSVPTSSLGKLEWDELVFEPKRAFLGEKKPHEVLTGLLDSCRQLNLRLRLALPTVIRAWDEPLLKLWLEAFIQLGGQAFEVGNLGALPLLRALQEAHPALRETIDLSSDFTLYVLNSEAASCLQELGIRQAALSIEDDASNLQQTLAHWPQGALEAQVILYKDTPLFIAEACSLTALHHGCPTAKVCGYRTLEIENDEGERFFVAHETCKSVVYGAQAYSISQYRQELEAMGVRRFRLDFLTRPYTAAQIVETLMAVTAHKKINQTHPANFKGELM